MGVHVAKISPRQEQILEFVREFHTDRSYMPSVREIQAACEISSTSVVDYNLRILEREGYLHRAPDISRAIELVGEKPSNTVELIQVPVLGTIAAGEPIPVPDPLAWTSEDTERISLPPEITPSQSEDLFALRVKGYSMIDAMVPDGDLVIVKPTADARNGEMVAAYLKLEETVTLKRFYLEGEMVRLQPENAQMDPIFVPAENVRVHGRVVGVIRRVV